MGQLVLVRHGQASLFANDYDRLSAVGEQQARLLGLYWVQQAICWDEVYTGPRVRQQDTAAVVGRCFLEAQLPWPEPVVLADLDEYDINGLFGRSVPQLADCNSHFRELVAEHEQAPAGPRRAAAFQRMFEVLLTQWQQGSIAADGLESWPAFRLRVERGLRRVLDAPGRGRRIAMFTSGGFIGTAVQYALSAPDRAALEVNWRIRNCSLTRFVFRPGRLTLDAFNELPHLADPALWTYR